MATRVRAVRLVPGSSKKICQLTGQCDREFTGDCHGRFAPSFNKTASSAGVAGTDLGASFNVGLRTYFLFGDTAAAGDAYTDYRPRDGDSIAYTTSLTPEPGIKLEFINSDQDKKYLPPHIDVVSLGAFEVPTGGFAIGKKRYIFFTTGRTDQVRMARAVLADTTNFKTFTKVYDVPSPGAEHIHDAKFINICPWIVESRIAGLPDASILLFGSGEYRKSHPYLAYIPRSRVRNVGAIRYFAGLSGDLPRWVADQSQAVPLFEHPYIGELSVTWNAFLGRWIMLYNSADPALPWIVCRVAEKPWGPWSSGETIFDPCADNGFCRFIHMAHTPLLPACANLQPCADTRLSDPGREDINGGTYGPYQISRYAKARTNGSVIYWVMSTWNPYNVMLMKSAFEFR